MRSPISLRGVGKMYGKGDTAVWALRDASLDINVGDWISVTGRSGTGKSTLLSILGLLEPPTTGEYLLDGEDVSSLRLAAAARARNRKIGFIFQAYHLSPILTAVENVELPLLYRGETIRSARRKALAVMEEVGVADLARRVPGKMSGGQQQRVAIARALVGAPALLLADEPTGNLDSTWAEEIVKLLARANADGATLVVATHDAWLAGQGNRRINLVDGVIAAEVTA